jgi:F-type H+-transporting ATPase subunit a
MDINFGLKSFLVSVFAILLSFTGFASSEAHEEHHSEGGHQEEFNVGEMIMEHVKDAHNYHLWGGHHDGVSFYLPIILVDGGIKTFSSSHFYNGVAEESKGDSPKTFIKGIGPAEGYAMYKEKIYKLKAGDLIFKGDKVLNAKPLDFSVTRNVVALFISLIVVSLLMIGAASHYKKNGAVAPKGLSKFVEPFVVFVRDDIARDNIGEAKYRKYVPYLLTLFFFIWISNMLGSIPLLGSNLTGNISVTFFLAVCTLILTLVSANKNYWGHIFAMPGVPKGLLLIMIPIEIVGIFTKPFALMIRLFANITAGHIIILALISIIFINKSAAWGALSVPMALFISVLELLVAILQAYLFALLTALFIGAAVEEAHH